MSASPLPHISLEQYLAIERNAEFKSEYYEGRMYAMSGGTIPHALIIANVIAALNRLTRGSHCFVLSSEARLRVSESGLYTYPDAMVVCGQAKVADDRNDTLLNPTVIVEVLSKSTEAHDRGFKFAQYRQIESLQEYLLLSQTEPRAEIFRRDSAGWVLSETVGLDGTCRLATIEGALAMSDIYANVFKSPLS